MTPEGYLGLALPFLAGLWLGEASRANPVALMQNLETWVRGLGAEKLFLLGFIGGLRA